MHPAPLFRVEDRTVLLDFIRAHPFGNPCPPAEEAGAAPDRVIVTA